MPWVGSPFTRPPGDSTTEWAWPIRSRASPLPFPAAAPSRRVGWQSRQPPLRELCPGQLRGPSVPGPSPGAPASLNPRCDGERGRSGQHRHPRRRRVPGRSLTGSRTGRVLSWCSSTPSDVWAASRSSTGALYWSSTSSRSNDRRRRALGRGPRVSYTTFPGPSRPARPLTMRPQPRRRMPGTTAPLSRPGATTFMQNDACTSAASCPSVGPSGATTPESTTKHSRFGPRF